MRTINNGQQQPVPERPKEGSLEAKLLTIEEEIEEIAKQVEMIRNEVKSDAEGKKLQPHVLNELLTQKLLKLDNFEVEGEQRQFRKKLINRINELCSQLDQFQ
eukprot:g681.t1